jgi:ATP-dependent Lon protease
MPGKIIQALKKAKTTNPLILLDEIDKMGQDFRGDPASAMLEVLDPEQNSTFVDHYLEVEYDLSNVMFITTANSYNMPGPLLDRMEIIPLAGYTEDEKREIATRHLMPKQVKNHGLKAKEFSLTPAALTDTIRYYTREAGVRNLERELAKLARKGLTKILKKEVETVEVTPDTLEDMLGVRRFKYGLAELEDQVGVVTGLAWTSVGGDLLSIEALRLPGKGRMKTTGKLGDVMKESIDAAASYVRSIAPKIGVKPPRLEKWDIHVHVPEGATPKDGPSAGIAMVTSIVSVLTQIPVRKDIAMTGEVTLRGNVLPIGGLKEKLLAALRGGITTVLIPKDNEKDLPEIPDNVKEGLTIIPVATSARCWNTRWCRSPKPSTGTRRPRRPPRPRHGFRAGARARSRTDRPGPGRIEKTWKRAAPWRPVFVSGSVRRRRRRRDQEQGDQRHDDPARTGTCVRPNGLRRDVRPAGSRRLAEGAVLTAAVIVISRRRARHERHGQEHSR